MLQNAPTAPRAELSRRYRFSASHRLHVDHLTAEHNAALFGKCNNPFGHGHNYTLQVTVSGTVNLDTGMVVNLADLDAFVHGELLEEFDFANLNEHAAFRASVPSTENLATVLWHRIASFTESCPSLCLRRVRVEETSNNAFDYFGEPSPALCQEGQKG